MTDTNGADNGSRDRLAVSIAAHENFLVARATGDLDYQFAHLLHQQVKDAWQATPSAALVVDLSEVNFCDSMGVGVLVLLLNQSREQQAAPALSGTTAGAFARIVAGRRRLGTDRAYVKAGERQITVS